MTYTDISVAGRAATRTITAAELAEADRIATKHGDAGHGCAGCGRATHG